MAHHLEAWSPPPSRYPRPRVSSAFMRHRQLFAGVFLFTVLVVSIATLLVPKHYTATAKMIVGSSLNADAVANLIQDGGIAGKVVDALKLPQSPAQLLSSIRVKAVSNTSIVSLSATASDPAQAAAIANAFSSTFMLADRELSSAPSVAAQTRLRDALTRAQTNMQEANSALAMAQNGESTQAKLEDIIGDEKQAQARLSSAQTQMSVLPPTIAGQQTTDVNPVTAQLQRQLADVELQLATARRRYTDSHPTVVGLTQQRDALQQQISRQPLTVAGQTIAIPNPVYQQLSAQAATLRSQIQADEAAVADLQQRQKPLGPQSAGLSALRARAQFASHVYDSLEQKYDSAVVAANSATGDVTSFLPADSSNVTVLPNLLLNIIVGILAGLGLGLAAVAIAEAVQRRIRADRDFQRVLGLPVIAHIPTITMEDQRALPFLQTVTLEAFLHLCASLRASARTSRSRVIVITSPEQGDGKSTIAYYLASAMSRLSSRVLLIDGDLHSPSAHVQAGIENGPGLCDVLSGVSSFEKAVVHHTSSLDVLTAGPTPSTSIALAETAAIDALLATARRRYDCVIIDTPALAHSVDSVLMAARADSTALVLGENNAREA